MNSIGSLGDDNSKAFVSGVTVDGAKLSGTDNGVRIKTYQVKVINQPFPSKLAFSHLPYTLFLICYLTYSIQGGSGTASDIIFQNIQMDNVKNPIIIDQDYCDKSKCTEQVSSNLMKTSKTHGNRYFWI